MISYVLGFLFDDRWKYVALIHKKKPDWQVGKLNGIGGKIEDGETPEEAMRREFFEETGVEVWDWNEFAIMSSNSWECYCFRTATLDIFNVQTTTNEEVVIREVDKLPDNVIYNLRWLIPLAKDPDIRHSPEIKYS